MTSRQIVACLSLLVAAGFLLLFASTTLVNADTYKMTYGVTLGCTGADGLSGTLDDSCAAGTQNNPNVNADMTVNLQIPAWPPPPPGTNPANRHSNFMNIFSFYAPPEWITATDATADPGAYMANLVSGTTLSLLNSACPAAPNVLVTIPLYSCSTNTANLIAWQGDGSNLLTLGGDDLPEGCLQYPQHVYDLTNGQEPRLRLFGEVTVVNGAPPTQVELVVFNPDQAKKLSNINATLTALAGCGTGSSGWYTCAVDNTTNMVAGQSIAIGSGIGTDLRENAVIGTIGTGSVQLYLNKAHPQNSPIYGLPYGDMVDSLGYLSVVILDNPELSAPPGALPNTVTEFCAPMLSSTTVFGKTQGKGTMIPAVGGSETSDQCYNGQDDDGGDNTADDGCWEVLPGPPLSLTDQRCAAGPNPMCLIPANQNPLANTGLVVNSVPTSSHLVGAYSESYRDADGDGYPNIEDGCPYVAGPADNTIRGLDGCPAANMQGCAPTNNDCDGDSIMNRQDTCPFNFDPGQILSADADHDNIGKLCDTDSGTKTPPNGDLVADGPYLNVMPRASVCVGATDTDGDGWCDNTECVGTWPACTGGLGSNPNDANSTPESSKIDIAVSAAETPPGLAPHTCFDKQYYDTVTAGGAPVDNDGDSAINAADPGCDPAWPGDAPCTVAGQNDADCDGVPDASDNCPNVPNPEQLNTDAKIGTKVNPPPAALRGDACDADDDQDGATDVVEWAAGTDPKNPCSAPFPLFDVTGGTPGVPDGTINTLDLIVVTKLLGKKCRVPGVAQVQ